jgi:hypothetical protein
VPLDDPLGVNVRSTQNVRNKRTAKVVAAAMVGTTP